MDVRFHDALADAELCIRVDSKWTKGYVRRGKALYCLRRFKESSDAYQKAFALESGCRSVTCSSAKFNDDN